MRKLILLVQTSLDGYVAGPHGGFDNFTNEPDNLDFVAGLTDQADAALLGRVSYERLNSEWPSAADKPNASASVIKYSTWYNKVDKFVFSKTLTTGALSNATVIGGDIPAAISTLKMKEGKHILIFGSPRLVYTLLEFKLLDDIWILIHPVLFGQGIPLFMSNTTVTRLNLLFKKHFSNGLIALHYAVEK